MTTQPEADVPLLPPELVRVSVQRYRPSVRPELLRGLTLGSGDEGCWVRSLAQVIALQPLNMCRRLLALE